MVFRKSSGDRDRTQDLDTRAVETVFRSRVSGPAIDYVPAADATRESNVKTGCRVEGDAGARRQSIALSPVDHPDSYTKSPQSAPASDYPALVGPIPQSPLPQSRRTNPYSRRENSNRRIGTS